MKMRGAIVSLGSLLLAVCLAACMTSAPTSSAPEARDGAGKASKAGKAGKKGGGDETGGAVHASRTLDGRDARPESALTPYELRFGLNAVHYPSIKQGVDLMRERTRDVGELGPIWLRHPGRDTAWFEIQKKRRGPYNWTKLDTIIEESDHPWVMEVYGPVGTIYPFREEMSRDNLHGDRREAYRKIKANSIRFEDDTERDDAEQYVTDFVNRYKHKVTVWEVGNEGINSPDRFETVKHTYVWVKAAHPEGQVMMTAVAGTDDEQFVKGVSTLDSLLERGLGDYFDIGNFHYYGVIGDDFEGQLEQRFDEYKAVFDKHGVDKPIWVTETATSSVSDSDLSGPSTERQQARHMLKRMVIFSAKGAEKVFWHGYRSDSVDNKFHGCNLREKRGAGTKPAFRTMKMIIDKIGYYESVQTVMNDGTWLYRYTNPDGHVVLVAWADAAGKLDLSQHLTSANALVTPIIEDASPTPTSERVKTKKVPVGPTPVFIEAG